MLMYYQNRIRITGATGFRGKHYLLGTIVVRIGIYTYILVRLYVVPP